MVKCFDLIVLEVVVFKSKTDGIVREELEGVLEFIFVVKFQFGGGDVCKDAVGMFLCLL